MSEKILKSNKESIKGVNYASTLLKQKIIQAISQENLPPVLVKYILLDITNDIALLEQEKIQKEQYEYSKEEKEKNK